MKMMKEKHRKYLLKLMAAAVAAVMLTLSLPLNLMAAQVEDEKNEGIGLNEFLDAIYSESLSDEEVSKLAECLENEYGVIEESLSDEDAVYALENILDE